MWSKVRSKGSSLGIVNLKKSGSRNETKPSGKDPKSLFGIEQKQKVRVSCKDLLTRSQLARPLEISSPRVSSPNDVDYVVSLVIKNINPFGSKTNR